MVIILLLKHFGLKKIPWSELQEQDVQGLKPNLGLKYHIFGSKRVFSNYSLFLPSYTVPYHLVKLQKKSLEWRPRARCAKFWAQLAIKMLHFGVKKLFHIIHYCHLCLLMVPYYVKKLLIKPLDGFQGAQDFGPNLELMSQRKKGKTVQF